MLLVSCYNGHMDMLSRQFFAFNTMNTVSAWTDDPGALDQVEALCDRYEHLFSRTRPESGLSLINASSGEPVSVDPELAKLIEISLHYCKESDGLYDITMGCVTRLWDFNKGVIPSPESVKRMLDHVGWEGVKVEGQVVTLEDPDASIDLGGIAKGYIADRILESLASCGVSHACANLGGNVAVLGGKQDGTPWSVGLRSPLPSDPQRTETAFAALKMYDGSVVTSGIYERSFTRDGLLYHHILDPRTGSPAQTDLLGATITARTSLDADGYTTGLIIQGLQEAYRFVTSRDELEAVFVTTDGKVVMTPGIGTDIPFQMAGC